MKYSVLMSLYHKENPKYFELALKSVFEQSEEPDQVVLVIDGRIDDTLTEVVEKYKKNYPSLDVYPQPNNKGLSSRPCFSRK